MSGARKTRRAPAFLVAALVLAPCAGGCESIYGIGDLPHNAAGDGGGGGGGGPDGSQGCAPPGTCTAVTVSAVPAGGGPACTPMGGCSPQDVTAYKTQWVPPVARAGQCNATQLSDFFTKCIDPGADINACNAFTSNPTNRTCLGCVVSQPTDTAYGASIFIGTSSFYQINTAGCVALAEPCNEPCARAMMAEVLCAYAACDPNLAGNCPVTTDPNTLKTQQDCLTKATTSSGTACACTAYAQAATCSKSLGPTAVEKCTGATPAAQFRTVVNFMCGPC